MGMYLKKQSSANNLAGWPVGQQLFKLTQILRNGADKFLSDIP